MTKVWTSPLDTGCCLAVFPPVSMSFEDVMKIFGDALRPDTSVMFGKTYNNCGRMCSTWTRGDVATYNYGGKKVPVNKATEPIVQLFRKIEELVGEDNFDMLHVVYYPSGNTKLAWHSDDEAVIAPKSSIVCLSLFEDKTQLRAIEIRPKRLQKVSKKKRKRGEEEVGEKTTAPDV